MKVRSKLFKPAVLLVAFLFFLPQNLAALGGNKNTQNSHLADRERLNILTINLLFSETETRDNRLKTIAEWVANNSVDVVLLQEVVGGFLAGTDNSAEDLQDILLEEHGLSYHLRTAFETGVEGLLSVGNATLSRWEVELSMVENLPKASELEWKGIKIKLRRNVLMLRLKIPDVGPIHVYNTHLCAGCTVGEQEAQVDELLSDMENTESSIAEANPIILGGDFNIDRYNNNQGERFLYEKITSGGFSDAYAAAVRDPLDTLCEDEDHADDHCTVGVSNLNGNNARRIDYIFSKGFGEVIEGRVVFNTTITGDPTVSDHAAVFTMLNLPSTKTLPHIPLLLLGNP
jgi:maltose 6'-phosphate phosphatase